MQKVLSHGCAVLFVFGAIASQQRLLAQEGSIPSAEPAPSGVVLRTTTRNVLIDVLVRDEQGRPVRGLSRKEFSVAEDGQPQRILSFDRHDMDTGAALQPAKLPANVFTNLPTKPERGPLYVLLYDMGCTGMDDQMFARHQLVKFIDSKPAGTRFAVLVISDGLHLVQGFTDDRELLLKALDLNGKTPHVPMVFLYGGNYPMDYPAVLKGIAEYVEGLPGRKNLVWLSDCFPLSFSPPTPLDIIETNKRELTSLAGQQIAVYPIVAGGLAAYSDTREQIARLTGGRALPGTNDLVDTLMKATDDGASYYTLSYSPSNNKDDGTLRHIQVNLSKKGYELFYRREYYADEAKTAEEIVTSPPPIFGKRPAAAPPPDTLAVYMRHGMPMSHEVIFTAHARAVGSPQLATAEQMANLSDEPAYFRKRKKNRPLKPLPSVPLQSYAIDYSVPSRQFRLQPGMKNAEQDTLEFAAAAYNADGYLLNGTIDHATSTTKGKTSFYQARQPFEVPAGATSIAVAVRDVATGRIGNLEIALPLAPEPENSGNMQMPPNPIPSFHSEVYPRPAQ